MMFLIKIQSLSRFALTSPHDNTGNGDIKTNTVYEILINFFATDYIFE